MSALGDYQYVKQDRLGSEGPILADVIAMYADKAIDELWAENERLKCCGNCFHSSSAICCEPLLLETDGDNYVETNGGRHHCHFKPSRWTGRETP